MTTKTPSRQARWSQAVADARAAYDAMLEQANEVEAALAELRDLKDEYQDWYDNMPQSLQQGPTGEKLQAVADLDLPDDATTATSDDLDAAITAAEGMDLPLGFGRD